MSRLLFVIAASALAAGLASSASVKFTMGEAPAAAGPYRALPNFFWPDGPGGSGAVKPPLPGLLTNNYTELRRRMAIVPNAKAILVLRHGEGTHNVAERFYGTPAWNEYYSKLPQYFDAELTDVGRQQATNVSQMLAGQADFPSAVPIITSPLTRAITTGLLALPKRKMLALENAREGVSEHTCDNRRSREELESIYASEAIDFSNLPAGPDPIWRADVPAEENADVQARIVKFLDYVFAKLGDEKIIIVVSHSGWWNSLRAALSLPKASIANCDMLGVVVQQL